MEPCRSLALLAGSLGLTSVVVALSTNYWFMAVGPKFSCHSGIWPTKGDEHPAGKREGLSHGGTARGARPSEVLSHSEQATSK